MGILKQYIRVGPQKLYEIMEIKVDFKAKFRCKTINFIPKMASLRSGIQIVTAP